MGSFEGEKLVYTTPLPWDGLGLSFQIIAAYSLRENRRKFTAPGMVVLQVGVDGKIKRLRLFPPRRGYIIRNTVTLAGSAVFDDPLLKFIERPVAATKVEDSAGRAMSFKRGERYAQCHVSIAISAVQHP